MTHAYGAHRLRNKLESMLVMGAHLLMPLTLFYRLVHALPSRTLARMSVIEVRSFIRPSKHVYIQIDYYT